MSTKQIGDFIGQVVEVYFELCQRAEANYGMGILSGAKRSVLLYLEEHGACYSHELARAFPDPIAHTYGTTIVSELSQAGLIQLEFDGSYALLHLTEHGAQKCEAIRQHEADIAKSLSPLLAMADINRATNTLDRFCHELRATRNEANEKRGSQVPKPKVA